MSFLHLEYNQCRAKCLQTVNQVKWWVARAVLMWWYLLPLCVSHSAVTRRPMTLHLTPIRITSHTPDSPAAAAAAAAADAADALRIASWNEHDVIAVVVAVVQLPRRIYALLKLNRKTRAAHIGGAGESYQRRDGYDFQLNKCDIIGNKRDLQRSADHECIKLPATCRVRWCIDWPTDRPTCITNNIGVSNIPILDHWPVNIRLHTFISVSYGHRVYGPG